MDTVKRLRELYERRLGNTGALAFYAEVVDALPALLDVVEAAKRYSDVTLIQCASDPEIAAPTCWEHEALIAAIARLEEKP